MMRVLQPSQATWKEVIVINLGFNIDFYPRIFLINELFNRGFTYLLIIFPNYTTQRVHTDFVPVIPISPSIISKVQSDSNLQITNNYWFVPLFTSLKLIKRLSYLSVPSHIHDHSVITTGSAIEIVSRLWFSFENYHKIYFF